MVLIVGYYYSQNARLIMLLSPGGLKAGVGCKVPVSKFRNPVTGNRPKPQATEVAHYLLLCLNQAAMSHELPIAPLDVQGGYRRLSGKTSGGS